MLRRVKDGERFILRCYILMEAGLGQDRLGRFEVTPCRLVDHLLCDRYSL